MTFSKHLGRVLIGAVALTAAAPAAHGQTTFGSHGCGGATFNSCALWSGVLSSSGTTLTFNITNTSGTLASNPNSIFDQILLGNLPTSSISSFTSSSGTWTGVDNCPGGGSPCGYKMLVQDVLGGDAKSPAPQNGLAAGQSVQFTFTLAAPMTTDFTGAQLAIHDLGGIGTCGTSNKVVFGSDGTPLSGYTNSCGNTSTVPEPSSMALLGTGLFGLVPMIRRKVRK